MMYMYFEVWDVQPKAKVTIGFCVKNCEATVKEAIDSIICQDYPHDLMEVIVVDGYSKDRTIKIVKEALRHSDIKTRIFFENKGLGVARQIVVDNAVGDYIVWVDGDMVISRDYVRKLVEFMDKDPKTGIVKGKQSLEFQSNMLGTLEAYSRAAGKMVDFSSEKAYSKALGTSGSIYRVEAIRQIGGFDKNIKGYCEDWDVEIRVKANGWLLHSIDANFLDYERHGVSWKNLWSRYWRRGYDTHYFLHKDKNAELIRHYRMFPPAAFLLGIFHAHKLFKMTHRKEVFLLPLQYVFKMTAWYIGFARSHLDSYEPISEVSQVVHNW
jgi:glycosyltransferase involved in cell wall biosynthesis